MPVTLSRFSFVTRNKESKVGESVDSLPDIGDFGTYVKVILNLFFPVAHMLDFIR